MMRNAMILGGLASLVAAPALAASYPAAPPPATSPFYSATSMVSGDISLGLGWNDTNGNGDDGNGVFIGNGRINFPFWNGWNETLELGGFASFNSHFHDVHNSAVGGFSHTFYKTPGGAAGLVLGGSGVNGHGSFTAGVEGAVFLPSASLVGQTNYTWTDSNFPDFWIIAGEGRWYLTPNDKLAGLVSYGTGGGNSAWKLTANGEHRFAGSWLGLFAQASWFAWDQNHSTDGWEAVGGVHLYFDRPGETLQQHDNDIPFSTPAALPF